MFEQLHSDGLLPTHWWFGVVEDVNDPLKIGRVRVRCWGYHPELKQQVPTADLPWALVGQPTTSAAAGGVGQSPGLRPGSWVVGFFLDGRKGQMPFVAWSINGIHKPNPPGYGSSVSRAGGMNPPPAYHGQPTGSRDNGGGATPPDPTPQLPGPAGMFMGNIAPNGYKFNNMPKRDTSQIKENSGYLTRKDAANWPGKMYTIDEVGEGTHRGSFLALELAVERAGFGKLPIHSGGGTRMDRKGHVSGSQHYNGRAFDINVSSLSKDQRKKLAKELIRAGFTGIGVGATTIHADTRRSGAYWGYGGPQNNHQGAVLSNDEYKWLLDAFEEEGLGRYNGTIGRRPFNNDQGVSGQFQDGGGAGGGSFGGYPTYGGGGGGYDPYAGGGGGGGTSLPGTSGGGGGSVGSLASVRSQFAGELSDPSIQSRLNALTIAEVGSQGYDAQLAFQETVFNRAAARGQTLDQTMSTNYYPSLGNPNAVTQQQSQYYSGITNQVMAGSNISNYATGNASGSVGFNNGYETYGSNGERFGVEGPDTGWANQMQSIGDTSVGLPANEYSTSDMLGFMDPNQQYPDPNYRGDSSVNVNARGDGNGGSDVASGDGSTFRDVFNPAVDARNNGQFNYVPTTEGMAWQEPKSGYSPMYPYNTVMSDGRSVIEMDPTETRSRMNFQHASGTHIEMHENGSATYKTNGDQFAMTKNGYSVTSGQMVNSIGGTKRELQGSDVVQETQGAKDERELHEMKKEVAGNIYLSAGENARLAGVNVYLDGSGTVHIHGANIQARADGDFDIKAGGALRLQGKSVDVKSDDAMKIEAGGTMDIKSGGVMKQAGSSYENNSATSKFTKIEVGHSIHGTIEWQQAIGPEPAGAGAAPAAPGAPASAAAAKEADEADHFTVAPRAKPTEKPVQSPPSAPSVDDQAANVNGAPGFGENLTPEAGAATASALALSGGTGGLPLSTATTAGTEGALNAQSTAETNYVGVPVGRVQTVPVSPNIAAQNTPTGPTGGAVGQWNDSTTFPLMQGDTSHHEPPCTFTATCDKTVLPGILIDRALFNVRGVKNFLQYQRRDGIPIPELKPQQLQQMIQVAMKNKYPLDMLIQIASFNNWSGIEQIATNGRQAFNIISKMTGRNAMKGEMYMAQALGIANALHIIRMATNKKTMNKYVVQEPDKRKKNANPIDPVAQQFKQFFHAPNTKQFKRWRTYRDAYDMFHHRMAGGWGQFIPPSSTLWLT